jgi:large subunit ribosomal protein L10
MPTPKKVTTVSEIQEQLARCTIAITTSYRGLTVRDISQLRQRLRGVGGELHVVKNSLAARAAQLAGRPGLLQVMGGPTAIVFSYGDVQEPAKALDEFIRTSRLPLSIQGAVLDGQVLSAVEVVALANSPSREVLLAQLLGGMQAPMAALVNLLSGVLRSLLGVLEARRRQLEEQ